MTRRQSWLVGAALLALALLLGRAASAAWADAQWFAALGAAELWRAQWRDEMLARGVALLIGATFAAANIFGVRQSVLLLVLPRRVGNLDIGEQVPARALNVAVAVVSLLLGLCFAWLAPGSATRVLGADIPFDETDPYFGRDLGFFVRRLPLESAWYEWAVLVAAGVAMAVVILYALTPALRWNAGRLRMSGWVRRHLTLLGAAVLALLAWGLRLDAYALAITGSGPDGAFTATDHRVLVPANLLLSVVTLAASLVVTWAGWSGQLRAAFASVSFVLAGALLVRGVLPVAGDRLLDPDTGGARAAAYASTRASYTRRAFGVDAIRMTDDGLRPTSTAAALDATSAWDPAAVRRVLERSRPGERVIGDAGWNTERGLGLRLALAPGLPDRGAPWAVVSADARMDADGTGLPPLAERPLATAHVYDGAATAIVIGDGAGRIAAPGFTGRASRILHAWALQQPRLLFSESTGDDAVVLTERDVRARIERLAPGFLQGSTVSPIVSGDSLLWALDLYSASATYPLSRRLAVREGDVTYYRHAATALVHATTGIVRIAARSDPDPLALGLLQQLAPLVIGRDRLPEAVAAALPVPVDGARAQAAAFAFAGSRDAPAKTPRRVPIADGADTVLAGGGPTVHRLGGVPAWTTPVVGETDTLLGVIVATGGEAPSTRWLPAAAPLPWGQALEKLAAADGGMQGDLRRVSGRVRTIPRADGGVVLVQPRYRWPVAGVPTLEGVVAFADGAVRSGRSLAAIGAPQTAAAAEQPLDAATRERLAPVYDRMRDALRRGDFAEFGRLLDRFGRLLGRVPDPVRDR